MPHIPHGPTDAASLVPFEPALEAALRPSPDYDVSRWLYVPNTYSEYRYILGTRGSHPLICVGINPSTAAPDALDPTLQSAQRIALNNGYDSFLMFNVYAHPARRYGAGVQRGAPLRKPQGVPLSAVPVGHPRHLGGLGEYHRKARLSHGLYARFCLRRKGRGRTVVHRRAAFKVRAPAPPPVPKGHHRPAPL